MRSKISRALKLSAFCGISFRFRTWRGRGRIIFPTNRVSAQFDQKIGKQFDIRQLMKTEKEK